MTERRCQGPNRSWTVLYWFSLVVSCVLKRRRWTRKIPDFLFFNPRPSVMVDSISVISAINSAIDSRKILCSHKPFTWDEGCIGIRK